MAAVLRGLIEQVLLPPDEGPQRGDQFLADGVQRRVGHLGEKLLEVVIKQLVLIGEHGQGRIVAH